MTSIYRDNTSVFRAKREGSYGVDPTVADANAVEAHDVDLVARYLNVDRPGQTSHAPGFRGMKTTFTGPWSCKTFLAPKTLTSGGELPFFDPILYACGLTPAFTDADPHFHQTYTRQSVGHGSAALDWTYSNDAHDDSIRVALFGCRGNGKLMIPGDGPWVFEASGDSASGSEARTGAAPSSGLDYEGLVADPAIVGGSNVVRLYAYDGNTNYATSLAPLHSAEFDFGMNPQVLRGINGSQVRLVPGYMGGTIVVEIEDLDTFNPRALQDAGTVIEVTIYSSDLTWTDLTPASSGSYILFRAPFTIREARRASNLGIRTWELDLRGAYLESGSDNGGLDPANYGIIRMGTYTAP